MFHSYKTDEQPILPAALEEPAGGRKGDNTLYMGDFIPEAAMTIPCASTFRIHPPKRYAKALHAWGKH